MKQKLRKITSVLLVVIIISVITMSPITASALTQSEFDSKLNSLRSKYPNYSTWYSSFDGGSQCFGFARLMGYEVFGSYPSTWSVSYDFNSVKAGDIVRYGNNGSGGHSIFVTSVSGSTITFVDCNGNGNVTNGVWIPDKCVVKWDNTTTIGNSLFGYSFSYIRKSPGIETGNNPVDIGTNFYALIINTNYWKPIENNNNNIVLGTENNSKSQLWKFERQVDNLYKIISLLDNQVIDLQNYGNTDGTNIKMCVSNDTDAQRWYIIKNKSAFSLIPKCSQNGAMDLDGNINNDGTNIHFWTFHGGDAQTFTIYQIESVPQYLSCNLGDSFNSLIINTNYWKPIENNNNNIVLGTENHSKSQLWKFERQEDNSYKIISLLDNQVIDLHNYGNTDGTNIKMCVSNDTDAQRWYIIKNKSAFSIIPKCSQNGAMDLDGNINNDGTNIHFWTFHGGDAQTFSIQKIDNIISYLQTDNLGDVNGDGVISIADATTLQKYLANIVDFNDEQLAVADTNGDGSVSITDATQIQKYIVQLIPSLG